MRRGRMNGSHYEYYQMKQKHKPQASVHEKVMQAVAKVSKANRKPSKLKWSDLPDNVLQLLKELGVYPKKQSYGKKR